MVPLKYLNHFWRILEMLLITCQINLIIAENFFITDDHVENVVPTFTITDT